MQYKKFIEFFSLTLLKVIQILLLFYLLKLLDIQFGNSLLLEYAEVKRYSNIIGIVLLAGVGATLPVAFRKSEISLNTLYETITNVQLYSIGIILVLWIIGFKLLSCVIAIYIFTAFLGIEFKSKGLLYRMSLSNITCSFLLPFILLKIPALQLFFFESWALILTLCSICKYRHYSNQINFILPSFKRILPDLGVLLLPTITVFSLSGSEGGYFSMFLSMNSGLLIVVNSINNLIVKYSKASLGVFANIKTRYSIFISISAVIGFFSYLIWPYFKMYYNLGNSVLEFENLYFSLISGLLSLRLLNRAYFDLVKNLRLLIREMITIFLIFIITVQFFSAIHTFVLILIFQNILDVYKGRNNIV